MLMYYYRLNYQQYIVITSCSTFTSCNNKVMNK